MERNGESELQSGEELGGHVYFSALSKALFACDDLDN